ncbi:MAG: hypothetical protein KGL39_05805 [Patescibacteria group bacterium]|nr:hypothetical protein [Patescibacteria group bacterium]
MAKPNETDRIREQIQSELGGDAKEIAKRLFGEVSGGAKKMSKPEYLDFVRRNWSSVQFRQQLLQQVGPKNFLEIARQAGVGQPLPTLVGPAPGVLPAQPTPTLPELPTPLVPQQIPQQEP